LDPREAGEGRKEDDIVNVINSKSFLCFHWAT
jgi:hypothetical protein